MTEGVKCSKKVEEDGIQSSSARVGGKKPLQPRGRAYAFVCVCVCVCVCVYVEWACKKWSHSVHLVLYPTFLTFCIIKDCVKC